MAPCGPRAPQGCLSVEDRQWAASITGPIADLFTCDGCNDTIYCSDVALIVKWKWKRHEGDSEGGHWKLLLCPTCQGKGR